MTIIVDTREQTPYCWAGICRETLNVGDYTTRRLKGKFHIERKSLQDLYGTVTKGNARFKAELFRAAWHRIAICIYVEGSREDFINKRFPQGDERKFSSAGLDKLIKTFETKYHLQFHWCRNRADAQKQVEKRLRYEEAEL